MMVRLHLNVVGFFVREFTRIFTNPNPIRADWRRVADGFWCPRQTTTFNCGDTLRVCVNEQRANCEITPSEVLIHVREHNAAIQSGQNRKWLDLP